MTDYNGFGTATTTGQGGGAGSGLVYQNDSGAYTFGQRFRVDTSGLSVKGARWYLPAGSPSAPTTGYYIGLWDVGGVTPLATAGPFSATVGQWNSADFATPVAITSGADYVIAVLYPGGYYAAQSPNAFPWDPAGPINFYTGSYYNSGSSLTYPSSNSGADPSYGIDVTVTDGVGANTVDVAGSAPKATGDLQFKVTTVAVAGSAPAATGALTFAATTVAVAGTAPAATGALVFARPITIAADGVAPSATGTLVFRLEGEAEEIPGSWYGLLDISREYRMRVEESRRAIPMACPNDGEPLRTGPRGELYCPFDGWRAPR